MLILMHMIMHIIKRKIIFLTFLDFFLIVEFLEVKISWLHFLNNKIEKNSFFYYSTTLGGYTPSNRKIFEHSKTYDKSNLSGN